MRPIALFVLLLGPCLAHGEAVGAPLPLTPGQPARDVASHVQYRLDDALPLASIEAVAALPAGAFEPLPGGRLNLGFIDRTVWLSLEIVNTAVVPGRWLLVTDNFTAWELGIWQRRDGETVPLLESSRSSTFFERPIDDAMSAVELDLGPRERSRILIGLRRSGVSSLAVGIETAESHAAERFKTSVANAAVYAAIAFAALLALVQLAILRDRTHLAYLAYVASVTLFLVQTDGLAFRYLWPRAGQWNEVAGLVFGLTNGMAAANFARIFLASRRVLPRLDRGLVAMIVVSAAAAAAGVASVMAGALAVEAFFKQSAVGISLAITVLCIAAGATAYRHGQTSARFYLAAWIGAALATIAWGIFTSTSVGSGFLYGQYVTKLTLLFDMLMFLLAMADQSRELRAARDRAAEAELEHARRRQQLDEELQAAAEARLGALLRAQQSTQQLAEATHDIGQPLLALKLTLARLQPKEGSADAAFARFAAEVERLDRRVRQALGQASTAPASGRS